MPRQKKVPEVPVETINAIHGSLQGAQVALNNMSYAQVHSLSTDTVNHIDSAVMEVNRAVEFFNKTYIIKKQPAQPAPRRGKKKIHAVLEGDNHNEE